MDANYEKMIAVMTAASQGAQIECIERYDPYDNWEVTTVPRWDWLHYDYRVKVDNSAFPAQLIKITYKDSTVESETKNFESAKAAEIAMQNDYKMTAADFRSINEEILRSCIDKNHAKIKTKNCKTIIYWEIATKTDK